MSNSYHSRFINLPYGKHIVYVDIADIANKTPCSSLIEYVITFLYDNIKYNKVIILKDIVNDIYLIYKKCE